jgi:hypothetical protein
MRHSHKLAVALLGVLCLWTCEARAISPGYVSDDQLAKYPIIVVAKWDKAPIKSHDKYENHKDLGQVVVAVEAFTRLKVSAVIKGKLEPGEHDLMLGWGISWGQDGFVTSGTSTELPGDVEDITQPCLWFLQKSHSWDEKLKDEFLTVTNYRDIQPVEFKDFYLALGSDNAQAEVPKLLAADKPEVAQRVLRYLCGGVSPWPYDDDHWPFDKPEKRGTLLRAEAGRVWSYLQSDAEDERGYAAAVYVELAGKDGVANVRTLLDDADPDVRGIAIAALTRERDEVSLGRFAKAAQGDIGASVACQLIKELAGWPDERVVPALIGFLQNDAFAYDYGDDVGVPALKAQQALLAITGHEFPFDVETAEKAWQQAAPIGDKTERKQVLEKLAPGDHAPIAAAAVGLPSKELTKQLKETRDSLDPEQYVIAIRLRNVSPRPVTILKSPSGIVQSWPAGSAGGVNPWSDGEEPEFVTLKPNESIQLDVIVWQAFLIAEPASRHMTLTYLASGKREGLKAWLGRIDVEFGADWKYRRELKQVKETWNNGNLKVTGTTVNGVKFGEWNFYSEGGDRIKIVSYGTGHGTTTCNPDHPDNKGAGKPKAE